MASLIEVLVLGQIFWLCITVVVCAWKGYPGADWIVSFHILGFCLNLGGVFLYLDDLQTGMFWTAGVPTIAAGVIVAAAAFFLLGGKGRVQATLIAFHYGWVVILGLGAWAIMAYLLVLAKGYDQYHAPAFVVAELAYQTIGSVVFLVTFLVTWKLLMFITPREPNG